jgi:hypothetical protein
MKTELNALADTSDLTTKNTCKAKRGFEGLGYEFNSPFHRRSGHGSELTWAEWQEGMLASTASMFKF